jgi:hypothetical protein
MSGSNDTTTDNFTVGGRWTLAAQCTGGAGIIVEINDAATGNRVDHINFDTPCGESQQRRSGTFFLKINDFGASYHITVTDQPG